MPTPTPARRFVEDLTTTTGAAMFGRTTREYLRRVRQADPQAIAPWRTAECPECGETPAGDGLVPTADGGFAHVVIAGSVVLGCEGFWTVDPSALGLNRGQWEDWR